MINVPDCCPNCGADFVGDNAYLVRWTWINEGLRGSIVEGESDHHEEVELIYSVGSGEDSIPIGYSCHFCKEMFVHPHVRMYYLEAMDNTLGAQLRGILYDGDVRDSLIRQKVFGQ